MLTRIKLKLFLRFILNFSYDSLCILIIEHVSRPTGGDFMSVNKGYILLTDTGSLLTKLIKLYTKKPYNHASIAFDSNLTDVFSFGRKSVRNPFVGGFVKEDMDSALFTKADCAIYSFEATDVQIEMMKLYIQNIEEQKEQYRYNFLGLFSFIINKPIERKKAFFCSQFVASVLDEGNIIDFEKPLSLIAPNDLQEITKLQMVFQGKLKDYTNKYDGKTAQLPFRFCPIGM